MSRVSLSILSLVTLLSLPAAAAAEQSNYTFRGDGFDGYLASNDGCRDVQIYFSASDYSQMVAPGQPQSSNSVWGYAYVFDCETQSWGWGSFDQLDADLAARGPNATSTIRGSIEIQSGHWEQSDVETCFTYEGWCWTDWDGNEVCEPAGEYCYFEWNFVLDPSKTLEYDLAIAPSGDSYRGVSIGAQKGPNAMYRYRYTGTQRYGAVEGTMTLDGEDMMARAYSWGSAWTASSGSLAIYHF